MKNYYRIIKILLCGLCLYSLNACVSAKTPDMPYSNNQKSNLTSGMVKKYVRVNKTTQTEIISVFGAPNIITRDKQGHEVWTYDRQSMASSAEIAAWNSGGSIAAGAGGIAGKTVIGGGAGFGGAAGKNSSASQVSSASFTLMISFDDNDLVKDYRMRATQF